MSDVNAIRRIRVSHATCSFPVVYPREGLQYSVTTPLLRVKSGDRWLLFDKVADQNVPTLTAAGSLIVKALLALPKVRFIYVNSYGIIVKNSLVHEGLHQQIVDTLAHCLLTTSSR